MSFVKTKSVFIIILNCLFALAAAADDIAVVKIQNRFQAEVLSNVVDRALTRTENNFLISIDESQLELLKSANLEFEILASDVDPSNLSLVRRRSLRAPLADISVFGKALDLGHGKSLGLFPALETRSMQIDEDYFIQDLSQQSVRITYLPEAAQSLLAAVDDFPTDSLVDRISMDSLLSYDQRLVAFQTRYIYADSINAVRDWLVNKFIEFGYTDVSTQPLYYNGWLYNVVAVKQGYAEPDKVIVVGGHYDSVVYGESPGAYVYAPGADDDGSGTSLTLELARILADFPCRKTIIFMPFTAEEVGLIGSGYAASEFAANGTDLEVMYNFDMVAYTGTNPVWGISLSSGANSSYRSVSYDAMNRVSSAVPIITGLGTSSDHASFHEAGFNVVDHIENEFNYPGWHTNLDLISEMNFPFFTEVARGAAAALATVANSAHPTDIDHIVDLGDGQSLEVFWTDCTPGYHYTLRYGTSSGFFTDSVIVPDGNCSQTISGLVQGTTYYVSVVGRIDDGYPAVYATQDSLTPLELPRAPRELVASPYSGGVELSWQENVEGDLAGYRIYRSIGGLMYQMVEDNYLSTSYVDTNDIAGQTEYLYQISAVDLDGNESDYSNESGSYAATFDGGILVVDEMSQVNPLPPQTGQQAFFDSLFGTSPHPLLRLEAMGEAASRSILGQYSSVFWFDDDLTPKLIQDSEDSLSWYLANDINLFICGFGTVKAWVETTIPVDHLLYQEFGLSGHAFSSAMDFAGANGLLGWPDLVVDTTNIFKYLPNVSKLTLRPGATAIYSFDSFSDNPIYEGYPCGVLYEEAGTKRILLTFPLSYLTDESARALVAKVKQEFNESAVAQDNGDVNGSGVVDISDLVYLVDYMFAAGPPPPQMNNADVDGSCSIDVTDITYFVNYLFVSGPAPVPGCVE